MKFIAALTFTLFLSFLCCINFTSAQQPMSNCRFARATWYPIHRVNGLPAGTCGFGPVADDMMPIFSQGFVSAPDDETYNGYPFLSGPLAIPTGKGLACGECFELAGPSGTITVVVADVCDKGCCSNCQGSLGNDVQDFDVESQVWSQLINLYANGQTTINYRKVACPVGTKKVSFFFSDEGSPNPWYFRLRVYNHRVGIKAVQVSGGANNAWVNLKRGWTNNFDWIDMGGVVFPFQVRVISILNQTITFSQKINSANDLVPLRRFVSNSQFSIPPAGFGGSSATKCVWAGPPRQIYTDTFGGIKGLYWKDWGSWSVTPNYASTTCPGTTRCISVASVSGNAGIQIGYATSFPQTMFRNLTLTVRTTVAGTTFSNFVIQWQNDGATSTSFKLPVITSTWRAFNIQLSRMPISGGRYRVLQIILNQSPQLLIDNIRLIA
eukprot:TRINITY_DN8276_c0_g1_i1.p1 TRINITY_DN8276_c0_g1~~TRINITY_DN8276_c0_g1_i1.p1  ORF type:complete len:438 (+),score=222.91 TRINITY_DN8276_c0_g1_i1:58-1371(+)